MLFIVDAFTDAPFGGNPAAVCLLDAPAETAWMQQVAMEMNLSETAFVLPEGVDAQPGVRRLRWFTPAAEVDLCGHATLATAHILFETGRVTDIAHFKTRSGRLTVTRNGHLDGQGGYAMDFPATTATAAPTPEGLLDQLTLTPADVRFVGRNTYDVLVEVHDAATVRGLDPDFQGLGSIPNIERGVIVTAEAGDNDPYDFISRFFAPAVRVAEDPVTGSAHCTLAPYWAGRLGRSALVGYQASERGGTVTVEHRPDPQHGDRVLLGGQAVTMVEGTLRIPVAGRRS
ncbi:MAG: PhzF family phenazine biosynthesis protein [Bacteroidota bacterium]